MRVRKRKARHVVTYGMEIDGDAVYSVRCIDGGVDSCRMYLNSSKDSAIAAALDDAKGKGRIAIAINGAVDLKEAILRAPASSNATVLKALIKNAAGSEMGDVKHTAAVRMTSDDSFSIKVMLMGMLGTSEIVQLFECLGATQCFATPVQGVLQLDGVHLHMGRKGAALYFIKDGIARRSSFIDGCRFEGLTDPDSGSPEERAKRVTEYLTRLTTSVFQDLTGWRRNDSGVHNRIFIHGAGAALSEVVAEGFRLREIDVELSDQTDSVGPEFAIARRIALSDLDDEIRSFTNPLWETERLERVRTGEARNKALRIGAMTCGVLALTVVPTVIAGVEKDHTDSNMAVQKAELAKYQPILAMYKSVASETTPITQAEAEAPDWIKVWRFLQATQPSGAVVKNLELAEGAPGYVNVDFSAMIASRTPFSPIVSWINSMKAHGAASVQTSTMTYSASSGVQTTTFSLELDVGSVSGVRAPLKTSSVLSAGGQK